MLWPADDRHRWQLYSDYHLHMFGLSKMINTLFRLCVIVII